MIEDFFSPSGPLAKLFPKYEARAEQVQMAVAVSNAAKGSANLLVEAGTGVGKSIGYLAPVVEIIEANRFVTEDVYDPNADTTKKETRPRRVIVSTGTINLQKQLFEKELPLLKVLYPWLTYSMAVGSENYLCGARLRKALSEIKDNPLLFDDASDLARLEAWARETKTGLRMDLEKPISHSAWSHVNRQSDLCRCKGYDAASAEVPCFYRKARMEMKESNVILVNHHLLMAHLTIEEGSVLPKFDYVIIDEIHSLEEVATQCFGVEISNYKIDRLVKDAQRTMRSGGADSMRGADIKELFDMIGRSADALFLILRQRLDQEKKDAVRLRAPLISGAMLTQVAIIEHLARVSDMMKEAADSIVDPQKAHEVKALAKRAADVGEQVKDWFLQTATDYVYQIVSENGGKRIVAKSNPIDVSEDLKVCLWDQEFAVIGASATISTGGNMKFVKEKLGAMEAQELVLASPFDYVSNALIYVASDLPEAKGQGIDPHYYNAMVDRTCELLKISNGRAMVLCTSNQAMKTLGSKLRALLPGLNIMIQGEDGGLERHQMVEELKRNPRSVILGVASFWQGVDVPGDALQLVVITKIPFPNVGDPLFEARSERVDAVRPGTFRSFNKLSVPEAVIKIKQGFGRLIRTNTDWGVVAILDPRVITKRYGKTIIESLPRTYIKYDLGSVAEFFRIRQPVEAPVAVVDEIDEVPF